MSGKEDLTEDEVPSIYKVSVETHITYNFPSNNCSNRPIQEDDLPIEYAKLLERFLNMRQAYMDTLEKLDCAIQELNRRRKK
jgi:hypothetical protein